MKHVALLVAGLAVSSQAQVVVSRATVLTQPGASPSDLHAARELRDHLAKITGADIHLRGLATVATHNSIVVGQGPIARSLFPDVRWDRLGAEQTLIRSKGDVLLIAGGKPRGTLYAVYRLLQEKAGVRWWTPWATTVPTNRKLTFGKIDWTETPAFEYRDPFWFHSFDADWAARNFDNGASTRVDDARGGKTVYEGFVHTYYALVPPSLFATHPEWFSLIDGKRTIDNAQLCTTNPALRDYVVEQVKERLRKYPQATIVSVSQNDCFNPCQCPNCRALAAREGSDAALVLDLANYVGEKIEKEFPNVAVDTLAYQWSRHPTKTMRPRSNVIVRLCSIECNFAFPLDAPENASFGDDIRGWSKLTNRLYVWDYCTNFANYLQPHPDYFTLGPTIRWFAGNGVKGVFEEGDYTSNGGDMAELKAWMTGQMLWNPKQDPDKLVDEFLKGYYGWSAAPFVRQYLELLAKQAKTVHLGFAIGAGTPFLGYETVRDADRLLTKASEAAAKNGSAAEVWRIGMIRQSTLDSVLSRWDEYQRDAAAKGDAWPWMNARKDLAAFWLERCQPTVLKAPAGWQPITAINEGSLNPRDFVSRFK